jgi:hypothetical protein
MYPREYPCGYRCPDAPTSLSWTICSRIALTFQPWAALI